MEQEAVKQVSAKEEKVRKIIREVNKAARKKFSAEEKIRIVLAGLRGEENISELCRREGIAPSVYYKWSKSFLEAGKQRLVRDNKRDATAVEVKELKKENDQLKRLVAEQVLKLDLYKKKSGLLRPDWRRGYERMTAEQKLQILEQVQKSCLPKWVTLKKLGIAGSSYYRWQQRFEKYGISGLEDRSSQASKVWNRLLDEERDTVIEQALMFPEESPRQIACRVTDNCEFSVSESTVYRLLKAKGLLPDRQIKGFAASKEYSYKPKRINEQWQIDATYLKVIGWGWYFLISVLDDFSRRILAWRLQLLMDAAAFSEVVQDALEATGLDTAPKILKPRLLSDNGPALVGKDFHDYLKEVDHYCPTV